MLQWWRWHKGLTTVDFGGCENLPDAAGIAMAELCPAADFDLTNRSVF
jgi:hypothetical protein